VLWHAIFVGGSEQRRDRRRPSRIAPPPDRYGSGFHSCGRPGMADCTPCDVALLTGKTRRKRMRALTACFVTAGILGALSVPVQAGEEFDVTVTYMLEPSKQLPEGVKAVAVLDEGIKVEVDGDETRGKKWAKISADMIEQMILDSKQKFD